MPRFGILLVAGLALIASSGVRAEDCNSSVSKGGIATVKKAKPGDWVKVSMTCGGVVINSCTATVAAGSTSAKCSFPKTALTSGTYECAVTNSGLPQGSASGGTCD